MQRNFMELRIIQSKHTSYGSADLVEYGNEFIENDNYAVRMSYHGTFVGGGVANFKEKTFPNRDEAINFFNNQN